MLLGELITLRQLHLPVKVVVFNNGALSFVELEMKAAGFVSFGTDLENPDFAGIASAVGLHGATVERTDELEEALRAAFAHDGPGTGRGPHRTPGTLIATEDHPRAGQGFALYATRTILSGGADEIFELAKTNLRELGTE
jgi:pyruvate dehydrogenase (quinone)